MNETYQQMKARHQEEFNALPLFYAFTTEQFDEALSKRGLDRKTMPAGTVTRLSAGGFCLTSDKDRILKTAERMAAEVAAELEDYDFAYGAFLFEMGNHEYFINYQGAWDVLSCFGLDDDVSEYEECKGALEYMRDMGLKPSTQRAFFDAAEEHYRQFEEL